MKLSNVRKEKDDCPNCIKSTWLVIWYASEPNQEKWICQSCSISCIYSIVKS